MTSSKRPMLPWADRRGIAAIEFAITAPFLIVCFVGLVEATRVVRANGQVNLAAGTTAELVGGMSTVVAGSLGTLADVCNGVKLLTRPFDGAAATPPLSLSIANVIAKGNNNGSDPNYTPTLQWRSDTPCPGAAAGSMTVDPVAMATPLLQQTGNGVVVVQAAYVYKPLLQTFLTSTFTLTLTHTSAYTALNGAITCTDPTTGQIKQPSC